MSTRCPICGQGFAKGEMLETAFVFLPFGVVGVSFHQRCFRGDEQKAQQLVQEAVEKATALARGGSSPTPPVIH
jgi:uncharacterized protein (UPF0212 family)